MYIVTSNSSSKYPEVQIAMELTRIAMETLLKDRFIHHKTVKMAEVPEQQKGQPLKYTLTHYRRPQHTHEAFIEWIVEEHLPIAMPILKKHGILGYSLVSAPYLNSKSPTISYIRHLVRHARFSQ